LGLNTTPRTWVASEVVDAPELNAEIRDAFTGIQAAWTSYTPTLTNITLGNGTRTGRYLQIGKTIDFQVKITFGSTTSITATNANITLPVTAQAGNWVSTDAGGYDDSANLWYPLAIMTAAGGGGASTTAFIIKTWPNPAGANLVTINATVPFTWITNDILVASGRYEAA
jgi:hypothetical protein